MPQTLNGRTRTRRDVPELVNGDHLDQKTFHRRYEAMPENVKAELVEGIVYMSASSLRYEHGSRHSRLMGWLEAYIGATPGVDVCADATLILGKSSEPQPDAMLFIRPEYGGKARIDKGYVNGAPELVAEVSLSSESIDLHGKLRDYERAGVREYLVVLLRKRQVIWYVRQGAKFAPMPPTRNGQLRSPFFPGLWLDPAALLIGDSYALQTTLKKGLATPAHARFAASLKKLKR